MRSVTQSVKANELFIRKVGWDAKKWYVATTMTIDQYKVFQTFSSESTLELGSNSQLLI